MACRSRKIALGIERKSLRHVTMVAKFLCRNKPWFCKYDRKKKREKELTYMTYLCMIALGNKTVAHSFLLLFDNVNGCLCQEMMTEIYKSCYHGNLTSHFSSVYSIYL